MWHDSKMAENQWENMDVHKEQSLEHHYVYIKAGVGNKGLLCLVNFNSQNF